MKRISLLFGVLFLPLVASAIVIDEFNGSQTVQAHPAEQATGAATIASSIGGARHVRVAGATGLAALFVRATLVAGLYSHSQDATVTGTSQLTWDGETLDALSPAGLGAIDLTQDGATAFILDVLSFDFSNAQPLPLTVTVFDAGDPSGQTWSAATMSLTSAISSLSSITIPFSAFGLSGPSGPARWTNIGAISLLIDGLGVADRDLTLERFRTNGLCETFPDAQGRVIDACGVCGGDGSSCSDCNGTPFGTASVDRCNVCGGDGTSCLGCSQSDLFQLLTALDGGAKHQEKLIKKMLQLLGRRVQNRETKRFISATRPKAHELQVRNWTLSWTIPSTNNRCTNQTLCAAQSYQFVIDEYIVHNEELRQLGLEVLRRLEAAHAGTVAVRAKYLRNIERVAQENAALTTQVPVNQFSCS